MKNARRFFILLTFDIIWSIVDEPEPEPERSIVQHAWSNLPTPEFKEYINIFTLKNEGDDQLLKLFLGLNVTTKEIVLQDLSMRRYILKKAYTTKFGKSIRSVVCSCLNVKFLITL